MHRALRPRPRVCRSTGREPSCRSARVSGDKELSGARDGGRGAGEGGRVGLVPFPPPLARSAAASCSAAMSSRSAVGSTTSTAVPLSAGDRGAGRTSRRRTAPPQYERVECASPRQIDLEALETWSTVGAGYFRATPSWVMRSAAPVIATPLRKNDSCMARRRSSGFVTIPTPCTVMVTGTRKRTISQAPSRG